jgi:hypothetical protein
MMLVALGVVRLLVGCRPLEPVADSPVQRADLQEIRRRLQAQGLARATVGRDRRGRVELQGEYNNMREVELAFSIAQGVVTPEWVSPVTPEQIKVPEWKACFERLLAADPCNQACLKFPSASQLCDSNRPDTPPGPVQAKYALLVGIRHFQDKDIPILGYPDKDAQDVSTYLMTQGNFRQETVELLQNEKATKAAVQQALDKIKAKAQPDDLVFMFLSSHGTPPDPFNEAYPLAYDSIGQPQRIWETSINREILVPFIMGVRAKRLVLVLDACFSYGAYRNIPGFLPVSKKFLEASASEGYGTSREMFQGLLGGRPKSLSLGAPVWGRMLISSSDSKQVSYESPLLHNGIFTYYFLKGLDFSQGRVKGAVEYARPLVQQQVKREKGVEKDQSPQVEANPGDADVSLTPSS